MLTETKQNMGFSNKKSGLYIRYFKRLMDFLLSLIAIIALSPVLLIAALLVRVKLGSPVIFKQKRPGLNERIFTLYKFRTMTNEKDESGELLPDSQRLTKFGRVLRSTSIDELPELFNILIGDMSIVGPRPLAVQYLPYYTEKERLRHCIRPGLTGLAQVNGRNAITWEQRFEHDINYVSEISFVIDAKIIINTVYEVLKRNNIGERGVDSPPDFDKYRLKKGINIDES